VNSSTDYKAEDFITKAQLKKWLEITDAQRHAFHERGLPHIRLGNAVLYHLPAVCSWLKAREKRSEAEAS
jgi:hypothetical protein